MQHLQPNTTLQGGKYKIERVLGQGGFGITYLAIQTSLNRKVAIKELFIGGSGQAINDRKGNNVVVTNIANQASFDHQKEKFQKEAKRLANLNHPNLVKVHEFFEENGTAYYVMDYIEGESLRTKLNREGCLSESFVLKYMQQLLPALDTAHKQSIWHLDIKPENIMVDKKGHLYLIDFGASKHIEQNRTLTTMLTLEYTPGYCPPELTDLNYGSQEDFAQALKEIGPWTDIYALGATMYNLLTDSIPPSSNRLFKVGSNAFSFPNNVSSSTQELIILMMKPNKDERLSDINNLLKLLKTSRNNGKRVTKSLSFTDKKQKKQIQEEEERTLSIHNLSADRIKLKIIGDNIRRFDGFGIFHEGLCLVRKDGKWGYINNTGQNIIACQFDEAYPFKDGFAIVINKGLYGIIEKSGELVVPCKYDKISEYSEGLAFIEKRGKCGYVDTTGNEVIPCKYDYAHSFKDGLARVSNKDGKGGYINKSGDEIIPLIHMNIGDFSEGLAEFTKLKNFLFYRHGFIDKNGTEVIPCQFEQVGAAFREGLCAFKKGDKWGYINRNGTVVIPCQFDEAHVFVNGLAPVKKDGKWGYIDNKGNLQIPHKYSLAYYFEDGLSLVSFYDSGKKGFINVDGNVFIDGLDSILYTENGCTPIEKQGKWGFLNRTNKSIINCNFEMVEHFHCGLAPVKKNGKWGYINMQGKNVTSYMFDGALCFGEGLAFVWIGKKWGCVDIYGNSTFDIE